MNLRCLEKMTYLFLLILPKMDYKLFMESVKLFESNPHYLNLMCLNEIKTSKRDIINNDCLKSVIKLPHRDNLNNLCCLPKYHNGSCSKHYPIFVNNPISKKLISSVNTAIYSTTGNDDYVYKNRASRLYPIVLSKQEELKIKDKNDKKKCAIPLKDASTPLLLAQAYLDYMTFIVNIKEIQGLLIENPEIFDMINLNKKYLIENYKSRRIFNEEGYSICVILGNEIKLNDVSNPDRDNRFDINENDIQLGHNYPRSENYVSIRGLNLLPMSRQGNRIIGEEVFTEDIWINKLKSIIKQF